ncbi:MAG TPA: hypothetical protein VND42_03310 [Candidatus Acidoferrales bacterium]|nr:hypothetical protein [Candidatus Acidoferrales bacterium]
MSTKILPSMQFIRLDTNHTVHMKTLVTQRQRLAFRAFIRNRKPPHERQRRRAS